MNLPITITVTRRKFYRAPHDPERVNINAEKEDLRYIPNVDGAPAVGPVRQVVLEKHVSLPEVYRFQPFHSVLLTEKLQWLWKDINWELDGEKWATLLADNLMLCNGTGVGDRNGARADYVNGRNLDAKPAAFDQVRFMGGAKFLEKRTANGLLYVEYIPANDPPSAPYVLEHDHLWYWATGIRPDGGINYIRRMGMDGQMKRVRIPIIASQDLYLPLSEVHRVPAGEFPEANWQFFDG